MSVDKEKGARVLSWRNALAALPSGHFFDLMRLYLGKIHTPYNKTALIEALSAFLRREENKRLIVSLLSPNDIRILSAVFFLGERGRSRLEVFFAEDFSASELGERLLNLEERLLIFRDVAVKPNPSALRINPLLEEVILPLCREECLIQPEPVCTAESAKEKILSPLFLASVCCFVSGHFDFKKADGGLKKRAAQSLSDAFPSIAGDGAETFWLSLLRALAALGLCREDKNGALSVDLESWKRFALLDELSQYSYLCASCAGGLSRSRLIRAAGRVRTVIERMGQGLYPRSALRRLLILSQSSGGGRFEALIRRQTGEEAPAEDGEAEQLLSDMMRLGLAAEAGKGADGKPLYGAPALGRVGDQSFIRLSAADEMSLLPGQDLAALLDAVSYLSLLRFDTAASCRLSREGCAAAFDRGETAASICEQLERHCSHELPQSLRFMIEEWAEAHGAAVLCHGYVLRVSEHMRPRLEKNAAFAVHILENLAPGVYLLDFADGQSAREACLACGLDCLGAVRSVKLPLSERSFFPLKAELHTTHEASPPFVPLSDEERGRFLEGLAEGVRQAGLSEEQEEALLSRVYRKTALSQVQLSLDSVRGEKTQAEGMDFLGKVHIIKYALSIQGIIEMVFEGGETGDRVVRGEPVLLEKQEGDMTVRFRGDEEAYSVGRAKRVRRIRGSLFKEACYE